MIQVTYLDHSGFAITTEKAVLVFDYYKDPAHALRKILDGNKELPVLFFAVHIIPTTTRRRYTILRRIISVCTCCRMMWTATAFRQRINCR